MIKLKLNVLIILLISLEINSQDINLHSILRVINSKYNSYTICKYHTSSKFYSILDQEHESSFRSSEVIINRKTKEDSISEFFILSKGAINYYFNGLVLYEFDSTKKIIAAQDVKPPYKLFKRGPLNLLQYHPFIFKKSVIDTFKWNASVSDYNISVNSDTIELTLCNSFVNTDLLFENSPIIGTSELKIKVNLKDSLIYLIEERVRVTEKPQVRVFNFFNYNLKIDRSYFDSIRNSIIKQTESFTVVKNEDNKAIRRFNIEKDKYFPDSIFIYDLSGDSLRLIDINNKYVLIDFWFTGCFPCIKASQFLNDLNTSSINRNIEIIGINILDKAKVKIENYTRNNKINYKQYYSKQRNYNGVLDGYGYPLIVIYDLKKEKVINYFEGITHDTESQIIDLLKSLD